MTAVTIDGVAHEASSGERLIDVINRAGINIAPVCYHPQLGPIQTCDTCVVEINGQLTRACAAIVSAGMEVLTNSVKAAAAQREAFGRILSNHVLYCTVCDNNNGNCTIHNTEKLLAMGASAHSVSFQALRRGPYQPVLPLRSATMYSLRPVCRSLPGPASQRNSFH